MINHLKHSTAIYASLFITLIGCSNAGVVDSPNSLIDWGSTPKNIIQSVKNHYAESDSKKHATVSIKKTSKNDVDYYELNIRCEKKGSSNMKVVFSEKINVDQGNNQISNTAAKFLARQIIIYSHSTC